MSASQTTHRAADVRWISPALWVLAAASVLSHIASVLLHLPQAVGGAMLALSLLLFGLLHGGSTYGWRAILFFIAICLGFSNVFENLSIVTGFPFGSYHYSGAMGPKLFLVPLLIGPAYFGVGYLSWTLARAILGDTSGKLRGALVVATPVIASFIMVSWDLTIDPMMSTITGNWIWHHGGSYFGVPFVNFLGWYLTVYVFYQIFALYARRLDAPRLGYRRLLDQTAPCLHVDHCGADPQPAVRHACRGSNRSLRRGMAAPRHPRGDCARGPVHSASILVARRIPRGRARRRIGEAGAT
jgi:uncharacterized membrane protein